MAMKRLALLLLVLALVAAACGGGDVAVDETTPTTDAPAETTPSTDGETATTDAPEGTDAPGTTEGSGEALPPDSGVDGPAAPDLPIPYEGGNDILLSQEVLPVYLVFWAEW
jgi:hypothetical protein